MKGKTIAVKAAALLLFAFSTVLGWAVYGGSCVGFLLGEGWVGIYRALFAAVIPLGCIAPMEWIWSISDCFNGLMAVPNFIALFAMAGLVERQTREHFERI